MTGSTPGELQSDAWVIRQNALRLVAALREFLDTFDAPVAANLARRTEARVEHGVSAAAVGLTAIDGVGAGRAQRLAEADLVTPADVVAAGEAGLVAAGMSEGVAETLLRNARDLPVVEVEWGQFPGTVGRGENDMRELRVRSTAGGGRASVAVTVNGVEMADTTAYLGETTVPAAVFGGSADEMTFEVTVAFPDLPLIPVSESRTVRVE
jgi:hypothetical protein